MHIGPCVHIVCRVSLWHQYNIVAPVNVVPQPAENAKSNYGLIGWGQWAWNNRLRQWAWNNKLGAVGLE